MTKLNLEKVMSTSFAEMADPDVRSSRKALLDYNRRIKLLGQTGRLGIEDISELIGGIGHTPDVSAAIKKTASEALAETHEGAALYQPGCSAVVVSEGYGGTILGAYENLNPDPTLASYGPGLMWAMLKVGQERYATKQAQSSGSVMPGYATVTEALTGKDMLATPHEERHHIGGSSDLRSLYPECRNSSMRYYEDEVIMAGVSGVLATERFHHLARSMPELEGAVEQADTTDVLGGFEGNMFAGSLDSTLATFILVQVVDPRFIGRYTDLALSSIATRHAAGINVH